MVPNDAPSGAGADAAGISGHVAEDELKAASTPTSDATDEKRLEVEKSRLEKDVEVAISTFEKNNLLNQQKQLLEKVREKRED